MGAAFAAIEIVLLEKNYYSALSQTPRHAVREKVFFTTTKRTKKNL